LAGHLEGFRQGLDSDLAAIGSDQAYLTRTDALVVPGLVLLRRCYGFSLLCNGLFSLLAVVIVVEYRRKARVEQPHPRTGADDSVP
jgi:hypothetical protein